MQRRNNHIAFLILSMVGFLCAVPLLWFTIVNPSYTTSAFPVGAMGPLQVTGMSGSIKLFVDVPIWLLLVISVLATAIGIANLTGVTSISSAVPVLLFLLCGVYYACPLFVGGGNLKFGVGPFLALLATVIALAVVVTSPNGEDVLGRMLRRVEE